MALLEIKNLSFKYNGADKVSLQDINLSVNEGEFVVICGESGCGKTTLLKLIKKQVAPKGDKKGNILFNEVEIDSLDDRVAACEIGFVMQNPDNQIVTDKVWHELAFGLESLGESKSDIRRKVAEVSSFFGINSWYHKLVDELSGGGKQLLNLASILVMQPKLLILDEPTSQLDPIAASEFIHNLRKINSELGITILLVEHRLEEVFPIADKVVLMEDTKILVIDTPKKVGEKLNSIGHKMNVGLPSSIRIYNELAIDCECPVTIKEGKNYIKQNFSNTIKKLPCEEIDLTSRQKAIEIKEGFFRYSKDDTDVLNNLNLSVYEGEFLCILGGNGAGKTTTLKAISGIKELYRGKVKIFGKKLKEYKGNSLYRHNIAVLPQNPTTLFVKDKVQDDLLEVTKILGMTKIIGKQEVDKIAEKLGIQHLYERHPYDLSGGEQQKVALAKVLLLEPKIILLDEATKGIDACSKQVFADITKGLLKEGKTIVMMTHDVEFAAEYADRCAMFFDGQIVSIECPKKFFSINNYYTTASSRISRDSFDEAVTVDQVVALCKANLIEAEKKIG